MWPSSLNQFRISWSLSFPTENNYKYHCSHYQKKRMWIILNSERKLTSKMSKVRWNIGSFFGVIIFDNCKDFLLISSSTRDGGISKIIHLDRSDRSWRCLEYFIYFWSNENTSYCRNVYDILVPVEHSWPQKDHWRRQRHASFSNVPQQLRSDEQ